MFLSTTAESKAKGDEGIYAAIDAARLAQALRGATLSRLCARDKALLSTAGGAQPGSIGLSAGDGSGPVLLGVPPKTFQATNASECVRARVRQEALQNVSLDHEAQVPVGLPDNTSSAEFRALLPYLTKLRPGKPLTYEDLQKLISVAEVSPGTAHGVTTLDLSGSVVPSGTAAGGGGGGGDGAASNHGNDDDDEDAPSEAGGERRPTAALPAHLSMASLQAAVAALQVRYPLPVKAEKEAAADGAAQDGGSEADEEAEDDSDEAREALRHNGELRARCELLQIPYTTYHDALRAVAVYETEVLPLLCRYLATNTTVQVVLRDHNRLGAESPRAEGTVDLRGLRALAAMLDANESIKVLDLSHNELGPNGVGVVAKALTKNICLEEIDLSENKLNAEPLEETEDPEFTEEDPVFGERYAGLEAVSEVLKKNKFLRVLRLGGNGIHAGDDLAQPADDGGEEEGGDEGGGAEVAVPTPEDVTAAWDEAPLWRLLQPLQRFHRLSVLDLRGNQLGGLGARMLATALATNHSVRALDLTDNGIGYRGLHYLASLVLASPSSVLETLVLQRNDLAGKSRNPNTQKKLRLKPKKPALAAMHAFAAALRGNRTVRRLVLSENHLGPVLSAALLATVAEAEALEELDFSWNEACGDHESVLDLTAMEALARALYPSPRCPHRPTLARLYLSGNNLCAAGLAALLPQGGLTPQYALEELELSRNYVGDALEPLSHLLQVSPAVQRVGLAHNSITTLRAMLPGLRANRTLARLDVSHNKLGSLEEPRHLPADFGGTTTTLVGSIHHAQALQAAALQTIQHNDAVACEEQRAEVAMMWQAMVAHPSLRDLNVSANDLRAVHGEDLLGALAGGGAAAADGPAATPSALAKVDVSHNPKIPASVVRDVVAVLASRPGMQVVYTSLPRVKSIPAAPSPSVSLEEEKQQRQAGRDILDAMVAAVNGSATLLDMGCCGLELGENDGETVEVMRRKLLLNALLTAST